MLQRLQSLWLLLAALSGFSTLRLSVYSGILPQANTPVEPVYSELTAVQHFWILLLTIAVSVCCLITIFLYRNRPLQIRISAIALILSLITLILYYYEAGKFEKGNITLTSLLAVAVPVLIGLAIRGIYKDEQLVKSSDRLR